MSKRDHYAVTAAVVLVLSGCVSPPVSNSTAQVPAPGQDVPSNTASGADLEPVLSRTPLPAGTVLRVRLYHAIDSRQARYGDSFIASLSAPVSVDDKLVVPKGTVVRGSIQQASQAGRVKGRASVTLTLDRMEWNGLELPIDTNNVTWDVEDHSKRSLAWIGGSSAEGAGAETAEAGPTDKKQVRIPAESVLTFRLEQPVVI